MRYFAFQQTFKPVKNVYNGIDSSWLIPVAARFKSLF